MTRDIFVPAAHATTTPAWWSYASDPSIERVTPRDAGEPDYIRRYREAQQGYTTSARAPSMPIIPHHRG